MAKTSGTATSTADLLAQLDTFLTANGWSRDEFTDLGGGSGEYYWNNGDTAYVSVRYITDAIKIYPNTGYDGAEAVNAQPGMSLSTNSGLFGALPTSLTTGTVNIEGQLSNCAGPYTAHHFYLDQRDGADYLICALEQSPGVARWLGFGQSKVSGSPPINGGEFIMTDAHVQIGVTENRLSSAGGPFSNPVGSRDASWCIRLDLDGVPLDWYGKANGAPIGNTTEDFVVSTNPYQLRTEAPFTGQFGYTYDTSLTEYEPRTSYSGIYAKTMCQIWATRDLGDATPDSYSLVARIPAMFFFNIKRFTPGQTIDVDGDTYRLFPEGRKVTHPLAGAAPNTQYFGVAMLEDV